MAQKSQNIMIWLLPCVLIGGLFFPLFGYLVLGMMVFFLVLSVFKSRYWCWNLCPRGAFLDIVLSRFSMNRPIPRIFTREWFRWTVFVVFLAVLISRIMRTGGNLIAIGAVFVVMCIVSTLVAVILGIQTKHRSWCMICPMGNLQEKIGNIRKRTSRKSG
jgi:polyferredoxin